jgi:hypothetical protein
MLAQSLVCAHEFDVFPLFAFIVLHTVDFQKRGLPHAHIIVWLTQDTSHPTPAFIDRFPRTDPLAYVLVAEHMVHGPCGPGYETCPCMKNGKCSKRFPKTYQTEMVVDDGGFARYRRSNNARYVEKGPKRLDSGWVVPYNSRFRVSNAKSGYRPVDACYMVEFTLHTMVSAARTDMPDFPKHAYKIVPIDALPAHAGDTKNFLGQLVSSRN